MFYAHFVLTKKGPLARIWLAAHWDKKLTKAHVMETNVQSSVEGILQPKVKLALRTSGHLLLGVVRIYERKTKYLLSDCNEAFIKIKMAFRPGVVDLPETNREAAISAITLPEVFHDFDSAIPDITIDMDAQVTMNQSRAEDITLKEDHGMLSLMTDDGFGDITFDDQEIARDATNIDEGFDHNSLLFLQDDPAKDKPEISESTSADISSKISLNADSSKDNNIGALGDDLLDGGETGVRLFEPSGLFDDAPLASVSLDNPENTHKAELSLLSDQVNTLKENAKSTDIQNDSDDDIYDMGPASMGLPSPPSSPESNKFDGLENVPDDLLTLGADPLKISNDNVETEVPNEMPPPFPPAPTTDKNLLQNEDETFALAPLDSTIMAGVERTVKTKRKRKLIVDEVKNISGEEMKSQLSDTTDIVTTLDLAPPTKRLMHHKETGGVEKLFALPGRPMLSRTIFRMYSRHLTTRAVDNEDYYCLLAEDNLDLDNFGEREEEGSGAKKRRKEMDVPPPYPHTPVGMDHLKVTPNPNDSYPAFDPAPNYLPQHEMFQTLSENFQQPMMMPTPTSQHMMHEILSHTPDVTPLSHMRQMQPPPIDPSQHMHIMSPVPDLTSPGNYPMSTHPALTDAVPENLMLSNSLNSIRDNLILEAPPSHTDRIALQTPLHPPLVNKETPLGNCVNEPTNASHSKPHLDTMEEFTEFLQHTSVGNENLSCISSSQFDDLHTNKLSDPKLPYSTDERDKAFDESAFNVPNLNDISKSKSNNLDDEKLLESDDDDDYAAPASIGPSYTDDQMADETYEEYEERILTKRTTHMLHIINHDLTENHMIVCKKRWTSLNSVC